MSKAIDVIRRCSSLDRRKIVIPEWDDMELYFGKLTAHDWEGVQQRNPKTDMERHLMLLILMARDKDGKPVFEMGDRHMIMKEAPYSILMRIVNFMYEDTYQTVEEAEEAIKGNPC